jgi:hypothetical protein
VWLEEDGHHAQVQSRDGARWHTVNASCDCEYAAFRAEGGLCQHLAVALVRRATDLVHQAPPAADESREPAEPVETPHVGINPRFLVTLHGKKYIQYVGLLAMAHDRGLTSLKARFISVTSELAVAEAEAVFADGRVFVEAADATPQNVGATVRAHFPRMALVRSKARCLRDALNIGLVALEEVEEV